MKKHRSTRNLTVYSPKQPRYPNAADDRYFAQKAVNIFTSIVSGMGFVSAMLFLVTMT